MDEPTKPSLPGLSAKAVTGLLGGVGALIVWRLVWTLLLWHLSGLKPSLGSFVQHREEFELWTSAQPWTARTAFLLVYTLVCALCLDGTATLVVVAGAMFGFWWGLVFCTFGSSLGAAAAFAFSRRFLGAWVARNFPQVLGKMRKGMDRDGDAWLLSARLIPMVSYSLVNLGLGLSPMRLRRFVWLSTLGLIPCDAAYTWAGTHLARIHRTQDLLSPGLWVSLCLVGLLPLVLRWSLRLFGSLKQRR